MKNYLLIAWLVFFSLNLSAQEVRILNVAKNEEVVNVAVYNQDRSESTLSDEEGYISLHEFSELDTLFFQHTSFVSYSCLVSEAVQAKIIKLTRKVVFVPEYIISATKLEETQRETPHLVDVISSEELKLLTSQTSADILTSSGNVFVQKSQGGGGSPVLRGFEANKILLVVDGIRMNNAIYRGGHLQNSITLDPAILEKTEIVYGPNASMYGSDALGGVIHYITRDPSLAEKGDKFKVNANAYAQLATANSSWKTHLDFNLANEKFGSLTSFTNADYGDIRMGSRRDPYLGDFGKCFYYIETFEGIDSMVENSNPLIQKNTGYSQIDLLQKFRYSPNDKIDLIANLQYSTSSNIPRYDMLNDTTDDGNLKYAVWNYGPQNRFLASLKSIITTDHVFFNKMIVIASYQDIKESRINRKYRSYEEYTQKENVDVYSLSMDVLKKLGRKHRIIYGIDWHTNLVHSAGTLTHLDSVYTEEALSRYPDNGSTTSSYAGYASLKSRLGSRFIVTLGGRYNYNLLNASYSDFVSEVPFRTLHMEKSAFTGSLGGIFLPSESSKINLLLSTGYRIPNLDDMAKIRAKGDQITFPNEDVDPEYTYNAELGFSKTFDGYIQINGTYFVSYLAHVIVRVPYKFEDGSDTLQYQGEYLDTYVNDNSDKGIIHGFSLNMVSDLNSNISFRGTLNYTYGRDLSNDQPLAHIPPIFGKADFIYNTRKFTHEFYFVYSSWKRMADMTTTGEDNEDEATEYGFPGWYTFNLRSTYRFNKTVSIQLALENVFDNFYKPYASGVAAPGINFITTLRINL